MYVLFDFKGLYKAAIKDQRWHLPCFDSAEEAVLAIMGDALEFGFDVGVILN
jgi:hypothetical protein